MSRTAGSSRAGSRTAVHVCLAAALLLCGPATWAQERPVTADEALSQARDTYGPPPDTEPCTAEQEAASISGEIVVCRRRVPDNSQRLRSDEDAERRYATATMDAGDPRAPDLGPPACQREQAGCFFFGRVPPRAIEIDFSALPEAPPGSDADRIARGLAPLGNYRESAAAIAAREAQLGLPPPLATDEDEDEAVNPPESAAPAAPPAGSPTPQAGPAPR